MTKKEIFEKKLFSAVYEDFEKIFSEENEKVVRNILFDCLKKEKKKIEIHESKLKIIKNEILDIEIEKLAYSNVEKCFLSTKAIVDDNYNYLEKIIKN